MATIRNGSNLGELLHKIQIEYLLVNLGIITLDECEY